MKYILQKEIENLLKELDFDIFKSEISSGSFRNCTVARKQNIEIVINCAKEECFLTYYRRILTDVDIFRLILQEKQENKKEEILKFFEVLKKSQKLEKSILENIEKINKIMGDYND